MFNFQVRTLQLDTRHGTLKIIATNIICCRGDEIRYDGMSNRFPRNSKLHAFTCEILDTQTFVVRCVVADFSFHLHH